MDAKHTPGPWRWEFNRSHKVLHLVGGRPQYDLTIMDFDRWGMGRAVATLRDPSEDGMNIMHRLCDRPDWIAPFPGRAHHADWCADVTHPDMRLIAAAPDHAVFGHAITSLGARWERFDEKRGEFCIDGFRYSTDLDEFGVPVLNGAIRAAIAKARGES